MPFRLRLSDALCCQLPEQVPAQTDGVPGTLSREVADAEAKLKQERLEDANPAELGSVAGEWLVGSRQCWQSCTLQSHHWLLREVVHTFLEHLAQSEGEGTPVRSAMQSGE